MVIVLYYSLYVCLEQSIIIEDYCFESTVLFHLQTSITIFRRIQLHNYHQIHTGIYSKISTLIVNNINKKRKKFLKITIAYVIHVFYLLVIHVSTITGLYLKIVNISVKYYLLKILNINYHIVIMS